ncbi:MAG: PAS domain S-box protein [Candidatus Hydrogenedentes bacterium]|nr:PAS domain S-box protein [Candidatus Hydrogenedentota bacterium]
MPMNAPFRFNRSSRSPADPMALYPRTDAVLRVEWYLVLGRYLLYFAALILGLVEPDTKWFPLLLPIVFLGLLHNFFAHWVFHTRRYHLFFSPINLLLYLGRLTFMVSITGAGASPAAPLYALVIMGVILYSPHSRKAPWVTTLCCATYAFVTVGGVWFYGLDTLHYGVYANFALMVGSGWLVSMLSELLRRVEETENQHEQQLRDYSDTLRAILDHTAEPILVFDENEIITEANAQAEAYFGVARQALNGRRFREFQFDDGLLTDRMSVIRHRGTWNGETLLTLPDGSERPVELRVHSFQSGGRRLHVALIRDLTREKELEEVRRATQEQLENVNRELHRLYRIRSAFYVDIARRLRSPLTAVNGLLAMLLDEELGELTDDQRKALQSCRRSIRRMIELVNEVFHEEETPLPLLMTDPLAAPFGTRSTQETPGTDKSGSDQSTTDADHAIF